MPYVDCTMCNSIVLADYYTEFINIVLGDNMLTALSVARDCGMVEAHAQVIVAHVSPPKGDLPARVEWKYTGSLKSSDNEVNI